MENEEMSSHVGETAAHPVSNYVDTQQEVPVSLSQGIGKEAPSEDTPIGLDKVDQPLKDVLEEESNVESDTSLRVYGDSLAPPPPLKDGQKSEGYTPPPNVLSDIRPDTPAQSLSPSNANGTAIHKRSVTMSKGQNVSVVLITTALETIASSKEAKRSVPLRESTQRAIDLIRSNKAGEHPRDIFEPLRLACETRNEKLIIASLDCISKLISYSFFEDDGTSINALPSPPPSPQPGKGPGPTPTPTPLPSLVDLVAHTITSCHAETTPDAISLQIVKALLALVLSHTILVHHSSLLKAVRTVYNIFLLSTDPVNQMVAQGGLTQMVHHVFTRCQRSGIAKWHPETTTALAELRSTSPSTRQFFVQAGLDTIPLETRDESSSAAASSITPTALEADENLQEERVKAIPTLYVCIRYFS
jgi:brefeldin A-inhibited guanine nucleotide-exchange protein